MSSNRRAARLPRALASVVVAFSCIALSLLFGTMRANAQDTGGSAVPDPSVWGTSDPASDDPGTSAGEGTSAGQGTSPGQDANRQALPDSVDARPPVAKMVWKTITTPSGRTFQVLEAATPEEIEQARRETAQGDNPVTPVSTMGPDGAAKTSGANGDMASVADLGSRPMGRNGEARPGLHWANGSGVPSVTAFGVYGGYSSTAGLQMTLPTDGTFAFRMGLTGFPGLGWLWTPGVELRFGQEPGVLNTDGVYGFSNLYIGETVHDDPVSKHWGVETGGGYRWILPDRRSVRWIAAIELGGRWTTESSAPKTPTVRAFWMIAAP